MIVGNLSVYVHVHYQEIINISKGSFPKQEAEEQAEKLKSREMKEGWMKSDEGWMKND